MKMGIASYEKSTQVVQDFRSVLGVVHAKEVTFLHNSASVLFTGLTRPHIRLLIPECIRSTVLPLLP